MPELVKTQELSREMDRPQGAGHAVYYDLTPAAHLMWPVRILEPPNIVLNPAVAPGYLKPVTITGQATCTQKPCTTVLTYGPPGTPGKKVNLTQTPVSTGTDAGDLLAVSYTIPANEVTLEGLNYSAKIADGSTDEDTLVLPVVIPNARRSGLAVTADTALIPPAVCGSNCAPRGSTTSLPLTTDGTTASRILIRIDTSDIPRDHKVGTARLTLQTTGDPGTAEVRAVLTPWDEATATWANAPAVAPNRQPTTDDPSTGSLTAAIVPGATDINIAPLVQKWVNNPATNYGLQLTLTGPVARSALLSSRESGSLAPKLTVTHASTDLQSPIVTMVNPTGADTLFQVETVSATLTDDVAVASAELRVDDQRVAVATAAPWDFTLDTRNYSNGPHRVDILGTDSSGNITRASVTVPFRNDLPSSDRVAEDRRRGVLTDYRYVALGAVVESAPNSALPERYRAASSFSPANADKSWFEKMLPYADALSQLPDDQKALFTDYLYFGRVGGGGRIPGLASFAPQTTPPPAILAAIATPAAQVPTDPNWRPHSTCNPREYNYVSSTYCTADSYDGKFSLRWDAQASGSGTDEMTWNGGSYVVGSDGVPDFVDQALQGFDQGLSTYQAMGFTVPSWNIYVSLGDYPRSVSLPPGNIPVLTYTSGGDTFSTVGGTGSIQLDTDKGLLSGRKGTWDYGIEEEARHELFHQFQYAAGVGAIAAAESYWFSMTDLTRADTAWWMEASANWAAHEAAPLTSAGEPSGLLHHADNREMNLGQASTTRTFQSLRTLLEAPEESLLTDYNDRGYGGVVLVEYLGDQFGVGFVKDSLEHLGSGGSDAVKTSLEHRNSNWDAALDGFWQAVYTFAQSTYPTPGSWTASSSRDWDIREWRIRLDAGGRSVSRSAPDPVVGARVAVDKLDAPLEPTNGTPVTRAVHIGAGGAYFLEMQVPEGTSGQLIAKVSSLNENTPDDLLRSTLTSYSTHPSPCATGTLEHTSPTGTINVGGACNLVTLRVNRSDPKDRDVVYHRYQISLTYRTTGVEVGNGATRLGVSDTGRLGIIDAAGPDYSVEGTRNIGFRNSSNFEAAMRGGCPCEGWGVTTNQNTTRGKASVTATESVVAGQLTYDQEHRTATATATVGAPGPSGHGLTVQHRYISGADPHVYYAEVTITRTFDDAVAGPATIQYRRNLDMDAADEPDYSYVTLRSDDPRVVRLTDHGSADSYPDNDDTVSRCVGSICEAPFHTGPETDVYGDYGGSMTLQFYLPTGAPSVTFRLAYVTAASVPEAQAMLNSAGSNTYALGSSQPSTAIAGRRDTFGFGLVSLGA